MKSNGNLRKTAEGFGPEDTLRKASRLTPAKKNGKEKRSFYRELEDDEGLDFTLTKRESVLDYYDDEDGDQEWDDGEEDKEEEEEGDEEDGFSGFDEDLDQSEEDWEE